MAGSLTHMDLSLNKRNNNYLISGQLAPPYSSRLLSMEAEAEEESVFEITDFTNATPWER